MFFFLSPFAPENLVSRGRIGRVPSRVILLILHTTQTENGAYSRDSSLFPRLMRSMIAYRWRTLPRVRRHRVSSPQFFSECFVSFAVSSFEWRVPCTFSFLMVVFYLNFVTTGWILTSTYVIIQPKSNQGTVCSSCNGCCLFRYHRGLFFVRVSFLTDSVCVCVFFLPIHSGHQVRWTYQPG